MTDQNRATSPDQRSRRSNRLPLIVGSIILGLLAFTGIISLSVHSSVNDVIPFRELMASAQTECLRQVQSSQIATSLLGSPIVCPTQASGTIGHPINGLVKAELSIPVHGPKGAGKLVVVCQGNKQSWVFEAIRLEMSNGAPPANLHATN